MTSKSSLPVHTLVHHDSRAFFCLILVGVLMACSIVVAKLADEAGAPRLAFLTLSMIGAGVILTLITRIQAQVMALNSRTLEYAVASGILFALPNALAFLAVRHVGAGFLSLSLAFPILITWIFAILLGMEKPRMQRFIGVVTGLTGGVILAVAKAGSMGSNWGWVALVLAMPIMLAMGNIYRTLRWPGTASPIFLAALMLFGGALTLLPFVWLTESGSMDALFTSRTVQQLLILEIAVFSVLYFFYFVLQKIAGPVYLSQIGIVAALAGALIAVFGLGETPPPYLGLAVILIAAGTLIFQRSGRKN